MNLSGCDAAIFIKESAINAFLAGTETCFSSHLRVSAAANLLTIGTRAVSMSGTIYLAQTKVSCVRRVDNAMTVSLNAFARVSLDVSGVLFRDVALQIFVEAAVPVALQFALPFADPVLDLSNFSVTRASLTALDSKIDPLLGEILVSAQLKDELTNRLRSISSGKLRITVPNGQMRSAYARLIVQTNFVVPTLLPRAVRVLDGAIAIGLTEADIVPDMSRITVPWGDYNEALAALVRVDASQHFLETGNDINLLVVIDTGFLMKTVARAAKIFLEINGGGQNLKLSAVNASVQNCRVTLDIVGTCDAPLIGTTIHVRALADAIILRTPVGFRVVARVLSADASPGILVGIGEIWGAIVGDDNSPEGILSSKIVGPTIFPPLDFTFSGIVPGLPPLDPGVPVPAEFALNGLQVSGSVAGAIFQPSFSFGAGDFNCHPPKLELQMTAPQLFRIRDRFLVFSLQHPDFLRDPSLWLEWQILGSGGNLVWRSADWADRNAGPKSLDLFNTPEVYPLRTFTLRAIVTRGRTNTVVFDHSRPVNILDALDRTRAFVRHTRSLSWDETRVVNGQTVTVRKSKVRRSAIHKVKLPGRCDFADRFTSEAHMVDYLDELPDPLGTFIDPDLDTDRFSRRLCPFCFYGSPRHAPRPPEE